MRQFVFLIFLFVLGACGNDTPEITDMRTEEEKSNGVAEEETVIFEVEAENSPESDEPIQVKNSPYSYRIIEGEAGWGYQIYEDSIMRINQKHIPSIPGTRGFETKDRAEKAARYVVDQINQGVFPPTVDADILKKIGAID